jgi:alpha,alpha-trehalase
MARFEGAGAAVLASDPVAGRSATAATRAHVRRSWATLTRSNASLLAAELDAARPAILYAPAGADPAAIRAELATDLGDARAARVDLRVVPADPATITDHGPLYLPRPYVVPGGRFQELYGWDSFFVVQGLLVDGEVELARDMTDDQLFEVEHYGMVLNASRTEFLTRSQPPLLSGMVREVWRATGDRAWLARALPLLERDHAHWMVDAHRAGRGLCRYFDHGDGPAPEVARDVEHGGTHYDRVRAWYRAHPDRAPASVYDAAADALTPAFYRADRAMRESGFDPTDRFGRFAADILELAPVCLNSLLYAAERDLAELHSVLGGDGAAAIWDARAAERRARVVETMWDPERGMFFDHRFTTGERSTYEFVTTFFPLWVGIADDATARRVADRADRFLCAGGLATSTTETGSQWDAPYGWAPMQVVAVQGLRRYGLHDLADRIAVAFLGTVAREYRRLGVVVEKYDVVRRSADTRLTFGYTANEVGFGWTNAAFAVLLDELGDAGPAAVDAAAEAPDA